MARPGLGLERSCASSKLSVRVFAPGRGPWLMWLVRALRARGWWPLSGTTLDRAELNLAFCPPALRSTRPARRASLGDRAVVARAHVGPCRITDGSPGSDGRAAPLAASHL